MSPTPNPSKPSDSLDLLEQVLPSSAFATFDEGHTRVFSTWMVLWLMIYQRTHQNATLSAAVQEMLFGSTSSRLPDCKRTREQSLSRNTGGYSQARSALPVAAAVQAIEMMSRTMIIDEPATWNGRRTFLIDGTSITTGHHPELLKAFPPASNQHGQSHWPVIRLVVSHELGSGLAMRPFYGPMYGSHAVSETGLARNLLGQFNDPAMIIYDRNFGIFSMSHAAVAAGHGVLARMTDKRFQSLLRQATLTGPGEWTLQWRPSRYDIEATPDLSKDAIVHGRLIEVAIEHEGKTTLLRLFTTDMTSTPGQLAALYARRWSVEGDIRSVKQTLSLDKLTCKSVEMAEKEILLAMVAYNLVIQVRRLAARQVGIEPRRLSFTSVLTSVQAFCNNLELAKTPEELEKRFELLLRVAAQSRLPNRNKFRSYPREVVPRRRGFPERKRKTTEQKN